MEEPAAPSEPSGAARAPVNGVDSENQVESRVVRVV
uniref:Uncharacterized protein n=1 Tax=Equus asinus TaxID=9793 RepID=A0A9L0JPA1_EQUAS